jgi:putative transposase
VLSIVRQCALVSISRSSFYYQPRGETPLNLALMRLIDEVFLDCPFYGARQMARHLRRLGHAVGRKRVSRLMAKMGLSAIYQKPRTSDPHPDHPIYPYLLKGLEVTRPNHVWCSDITYIPMRRGFLYLVAIMDWATRKVLSWRLSNTMEADFCIEALETRDLQHRSGQSVYQPPVHRGPDGRQGPDQHGWQGTVDGQCVYRKALAVREIRMRVSPRL